MRIPPTFRVHLASLFLLAIAVFGAGRSASAQEEGGPGTPGYTGPNLEIPIPGIEFSGIIRDNDITIPWLGQYIGGVYAFLISIVGLFAATVIIFGGFQYVTAAGDKGKIGAARKRIMNAFIGLLLVFGSYTILYAVNPALTKFEGLRIAGVQPKLFGGNFEARSEESNPEPGTMPGSCADAGYHITDPLAFDKGLNSTALSYFRANLIKKYPQMVAVYKKAEAATDVPWELLAAVHYGEGGNNPKQSILNGNYELCNTNDDPGAKTVCTECQLAKTIESDVTCGARLLQRSVAKYGKITTADSVSNYDIIKIALCRYNGCSKAGLACPEATPYVAARFDQQHMSYPPKTAHDCIWAQCNPGAEMNDATLQKRKLTGSCGIIVFERDFIPPFTIDGSRCNSNLSQASCCTSIGDHKLKCTYTPTDYSKNNPCGTKIYKQNHADRPGAFVGYGIIKYLEQQGEIR